MRIVTACCWQRPSRRSSPPGESALETGHASFVTVRGIPFVGSSPSATHSATSSGCGSIICGSSGPRRASTSSRSRARNAARSGGRKRPNQLSAIVRSVVAAPSAGRTPRQPCLCHEPEAAGTHRSRPDRKSECASQDLRKRRSCKRASGVSFVSQRSSPRRGQLNLLQPCFPAESRHPPLRSLCATRSLE